MKALENFIVLVLTTEPLPASDEKQQRASLTFSGDKLIYINHHEYGYFHGVWFTIYYSKP